MSPDSYTLSTGQTYRSGQAVGGLWDEMGELQFRYLMDQGLRPEHRLLDIGCGSLRGGVHFVQALDDGNYYGMDAADWLLTAAREVELPRYGLADRTVHLECRDDFRFSAFDTTFDLAIAQSVFTHLRWNSIQRCLEELRGVMHEGGRFYATYFEDIDEAHRASDIRHQPGGITTHPDADPYHYAYEALAWLARRTGFSPRNVGDWGHPRGQRMLEFTAE